MLRVERIPAIDAIKAVAIIAVVATHSGSGIFGPGPDRIVDWLTFDWTPFHVPAFLMLAGFLYHRPAPIGGAIVRARLLRLLVPYLIASVFVQALRLYLLTRVGPAALEPLGLSAATEWTTIAFQLLTGASLGIYYFILILTWCIGLTWPLSRTPRSRVAAILAVALPATIVVEAAARVAPGERLFGGYVRGQLVYATEFGLYPLAYFLIGWLAGANRERLGQLAREHPVACLGTSLSGILAFLVAAPWTETFMPVPSAARVIYSLSATVALSFVPASIASRPAVRFLSEATLGIYLYHALFQLPLRGPLGPADPVARALGLLATGLAGACGLCAAARRLLGGRARLLLGA